MLVASYILPADHRFGVVLAPQSLSHVDLFSAFDSSLIMVNTFRCEQVLLSLKGAFPCFLNSKLILECLLLFHLT